MINQARDGWKRAQPAVGRRADETWLAAARFGPATESFPPTMT